MLGVLTLLLLFTEAECAEYRQRALVEDPVKVAHEAVVSKWRELGGAVEPGEVSAAFFRDCRILIVTEVE